jgi:hypothetical protein
MYKEELKEPLLHNLLIIIFHEVSQQDNNLWQTSPMYSVE